MSRDFAKRNAAPARRSSAANKPAPAWLWFVIGAICGAFGMALVFTWHTNQAKQQPAAEPPNPSANGSKTPKPRFDFYKLLQESEVIVPATETASEAEKNSEQSSASNVEFILQVGSFPAQPEADKLRAQLLLLNLDAHIEPVEIHKGEVWHRVVVGPFDSQEKLASARSKLVENQYTALVLKRAKGGKH